MNNLFFNLPEDLQFKIITSNPHPIRKIFKDAYNKFQTKSYTEIKEDKLWHRVYRNDFDKNSITVASMYEKYSMILEYNPGDDVDYYIQLVDWLRNILLM